LHGSVVSHSLFPFVHSSFTLVGEAGTSTTGSSHTGRFPFFVLEVANPCTASSPCFSVTRWKFLLLGS
jgi:hypothetical protein